MREVIYSPIFSVLLCMGSFEVGRYLHKKTQFALCNPIVIALILVAVMLHSLQLPLEVFKENTTVINMLLGPVTVVLALPMYRQREQLKANILPILIGSAVGTLASMVSIVGLGYLLGLEDVMTYSLLAKSVTTPIAVEVSGQFGGIVGITLIGVTITGITGAVIGPSILKLFRIKEAIAVGVAMGTSSHALGTSKAVQLGEVEGAMSSIAIGVAGIFTVLMSLISF